MNKIMKRFPNAHCFRSIFHALATITLKAHPQSGSFILNMHIAGTCPAPGTYKRMRYCAHLAGPFFSVDLSACEFSDNPGSGKDIPRVASVFKYSEISPVYFSAFLVFSMTRLARFLISASIF